ncbi:peptidoglycan DD-metalloendopeptidase family protein [Yoonia sp. 208BN28-4]|uniref:peptidoglycan DD-metalloendopeptidase family protein n=1 Tax=Yoonia sp. 208BN28-4 TaxID=3126505 RepID=UPI0030AE845E
MATRLMMLTAAAALMAGCADFDFDMRDVANGFDTSQAVENLPDRPAPDDRGVISYPTYQVVVARRDDTIAAIAARLGLNAGELARYNGIEADTILRRDEIIALPSRVTEPSPATGSTTTGPLDVTAIATSALDRAGPQTAVATPQASVTPAAAGAEPLRHQVARGETAFSIARLYNVPVRNIASWNALGPDLSVREGQFLLIPQDGATAPTPVASQPEVEQPGTGSVTPVPPSAAAPLPDETPEAPTPPEATPETPDIGTAAPAPAASDARLVYPVTGSIIRGYAPGRNEGIDIGVPPGTAVKAADAGEVAAVTTDTSGVAIVVIKHADNLLTVYTNLEGLAVAKGDTVSRGQQIARVRDADPSFLHFEVRRGLQSVDPADFLP